MSDCHGCEFCTTAEEAAEHSEYRTALMAALDAQGPLPVCQCPFVKAWSPNCPIHGTTEANQ